MAEKSLKKRYVAKLATNLIGLAISLVTQALIPRGLGPKAYGDFSFLSDFFRQLMPFFSLSTLTGFYTKVSQRQDDKGLISFYFQFSALVSFAVFLFVMASQLTGLANFFWVDQQIIYVYMASVWAMLTWFVQILGNIGDAFAVTVSAEIAKIIQKLISLALVAFLFVSGWMNLHTFFLYHYSILIFLAVSLLWVVSQGRKKFFSNWGLSRLQVKQYAGELYEYSHPLFFYGLVGMVVSILDRWMLQRYSGSVQQGFFGLSSQIGMVCFLFTSAMTSLITREFSISYANGDKAGMAKLFRRYIPLLYGVAAYFGCFACIHAKAITYIFGGNQFAGAALPVAVMSLYPIHQTYGQLSGSVFYATGQTKLYRNIGMIFCLISVPLTFFLIAPKQSFGLDAGALGLALKFLIANFIVVNVQLWFNAKYLNLVFWKYFVHQFLCAGCLLFLGFLSDYAASLIPFLRERMIGSLLFSGMLYTLCVTALIIAVPCVFGLYRQDMNFLFSKIRRVFYA